MFCIQKYGVGCILLENGWFYNVWESSYSNTKCRFKRNSALQNDF